MDLQSIAAITNTVPFLGGTVEVSGLSLRKLTGLIVKYPELVSLVSGKADIEKLVISAPEAMLSIVALGTPEMSDGDNQKLLKAFDDAATGQQIDLLGSIIDLTFAGQRAAPFLASLVSRSKNPEVPVETPAETLPSSLST